MFGTTKTATEAPAIVFAAATVGTMFEGVRVSLQQGDPWLADDAFCVARPDLFEDYPSRPHGTMP